MFIKRMPTGQMQTNCYLLGDEEAGVCAVVDPGDDAPDIKQMIEDKGLTLQMILLTHGHFDHVTAVPQLREYYPAVPIYIHPDDYAETGEPAFYQMPPVSNVIFFRDGDALKLGGLTVEVIGTPGHTPGSVSLKAGQALFTGDTLFQGSLGRTDFPGGSYADIRRSLRRLGELAGNYQVCPGHGDTATLETERRTNYFLREAMEDD